MLAGLTSTTRTHGCLKKTSLSCSFFWEMLYTLWSGEEGGKTLEEILLNRRW
jgi:hypothetical protein